MTKKYSGPKLVILSSILAVVGVFCATLLLEGVLRVKNLSMKNYEVEMWRYAKDLKVRSENPKLGHEHRRSTASTLQSVNIRLNDLGMRGGPLRPREDKHRVILFLGSSITLGWGVAEEETITGQIEKQFKGACKNVEVLNGGIGNYNSERYVELFFKHLHQVNPTDIVVHYFLRDAEVLDAGRGNWVLQNSQLAVTGWNLFQQMKFSKTRTTVDSHYQSLYQEDKEGYQRMKAALTKLAEYCKAKGIRMYLAMTPDIHNLTEYPFEGIHTQVGTLAKDLGYTFVDLLPSLKGLKANEIWSLPDDPHPNALGHQRMANALFPVLNQF